MHDGAVDEARTVPATARPRAARVSRAGTRIASRIDEYPLLVRVALRVVLSLSGLSGSERSEAYLQAMNGADPTADVTHLLRRDLTEAAARRRSVFPWLLLGVNLAVLAAAWVVARRFGAG